MITLDTNQICEIIKKALVAQIESKYDSIAVICDSKHSSERFVDVKFNIQAYGTTFHFSSILQYIDSEDVAGSFNKALTSFKKDFGKDIAKALRTLEDLHAEYGANLLIEQEFRTRRLYKIKKSR
jgi:hypothetical protein